MENKIFDLLEKMYIEMQGLKGEVKGLKSEISDVKTELKGDITGLKGDISDMKGDITGLRGEISELKYELKDVNKTVVTLELKIERDIQQKLEVLFDGQKQQTDKLDRIATEVARHEEVIIRRVK